MEFNAEQFIAEAKRLHAEEAAAWQKELRQRQLDAIISNKESLRDKLKHILNIEVATEDLTMDEDRDTVHFMLGNIHLYVGMRSSYLMGMAHCTKCEQKIGGDMVRSLSDIGKMYDQMEKHVCPVVREPDPTETPTNYTPRTTDEKLIEVIREYVDSRIEALTGAS